MSSNFVTASTQQMKTALIDIILYIFLVYVNVDLIENTFVSTNKAKQLDVLCH